MLFKLIHFVFGL